MIFSILEAKFGSFQRADRNGMRCEQQEGSIRARFGWATPVSGYETSLNCSVAERPISGYGTGIRGGRRCGGSKMVKRHVYILCDSKIRFTRIE